MAPRRVLYYIYVERGLNTKFFKTIESFHDLSSYLSLIHYNFEMKRQIDKTEGTFWTC